MRIVYIQYTNPAGYPPLEHSSRILASAGWEVLFLGTGVRGASKLAFPSHSRVTVRQLPYCAPGLRQKVHYVIYGIWVLAWVVLWRPIWIYASDPLACPIAWVLSLIPGLRVIYHEHDSPTPGNGSNRLMLLARRLVAKRATCSILPNEIRAEHFRTKAARSSSPVFCVWNCPTKDEISELRTPVGDDIRVVYHGSIVPSRLPVSVLHAIARLPESVKLRVAGYETAGSSGYLDTLRRTARDLGIAERVEFSGSVPMRSELMQQCRKCDIGLALVPLLTDDFNMVAMAGASNKAFDYLAAGLPLVVSDLPEWRAAFVRPGYGIPCEPDDERSIESALEWFLKHPVEMRMMGERGRQRILGEWNYELQFAKVHTHLRSLNRSSTDTSADAGLLPHSVRLSSSPACGAHGAKKPY